jgi:hypothetical protein
MPPDEDLKPDVPKTVKVQVGKLRDYIASMSQMAKSLENYAKEEEELAAYGPRAIDWENPCACCVEVAAYVTERARCFATLVFDSDANSLPDDAFVEVPVKPLQEWLRGIISEHCAIMRSELSRGKTISDAAEYKLDALERMRDKFYINTGITDEHLGMTRTKKNLVNNEEFQTFKQGKIPVWVSAFCKLCDYSPAEALELNRRCSEPSFRQEFIGECENLRHFLLAIAWMREMKHVDAMQSDEEIGLKAKQLVESTHPIFDLMSANELCDALLALRKLVALWKERHGELPP